MELENKFLVLKWTDLHAALTEVEFRQLEHLVSTVHAYRASFGKPDNNYVVINQDEPYFPDVLKLMEQAEKGARDAS